MVHRNPPALLIVTLGGLFFTAVVHGHPIAVAHSLPTTVTIAGAVDEALRSNPSLKATRQLNDLSEAQRTGAGLSPNPQLSFSADHLDWLGTGFDELNAAGPPEYAARVDMTVETGGKRDRRLDVARSSGAVAQATILRETLALTQQVREAAIEVVAAHEDVNASSESASTLEDLLQRLNGADAGRKPSRAERLRLEVATLQTLNLRRKATLRLTRAREQLHQLLGRDAVAPQVDVLDEPRWAAILPEQEELLRAAMEHRAEIVAARHEVDRANHEVASQRAQAKSDVSLGAEVRRQQGLAAQGSSAGLFVSIPLAFNDRNQGEIAHALAEHRQAVARLDATRHQLRNDVHSNLEEYRAGLETARLLTGFTVPRAEALLDEQWAAMDQGTSGALDILDATLMLEEARTSAVEARLLAARLRFTVEDLLGRPLVDAPVHAHEPQGDASMIGLLADLDEAEEEAGGGSSPQRVSRVTRRKRVSRRPQRRTLPSVKAAPRPPSSKRPMRGRPPINKVKPAAPKSRRPTRPSSSN